MELKEIYEKSQEYIDIRNQDSEVYKQYFDIVLNWKIKYLSIILPVNIKICKILEVGCATGELLRNLP
ncbi:MAG: hypothetical protein HY738_19680, partial [Bacteroidia bacterium]|nr:hypothetical protein [Bacteroidia bacterium]